MNLQYFRPEAIEMVPFKFRILPKIRVSKPEYIEQDVSNFKIVNLFLTF